VRAIACQTGFFESLRHAERRVHPPFRVDATESIAPGRHAILWRLLSYRKPWRRWNPDPWRFEMLLRDEVRHTDIELRADEKGNLVPMEQERS
jgi:hypothetical protein